MVREIGCCAVRRRGRRRSFLGAERLFPIQSNAIDIQLANEAVIELSNVGSKLGGRFIYAPDGGSVGVRGGYWQCGPSGNIEVNGTAGLYVSLASISFRVP